MDWIFVPLIQVFVFPYSYDYDDVKCLFIMLNFTWLKAMYM